MLGSSRHFKHTSIEKNQLDERLIYLALKNTFKDVDT